MRELGQTGKVQESNMSGFSSEPSNSPASFSGEGHLWEAVFPLIAFIVVNRFIGLLWAILAATIWSTIIAFQRSRRGHPIGRFLPIVTVGIIARGIVGIVTDSEAVYFGIGIGIKASVGFALILSVCVRKNLLTRYAPEVFGFDEEFTKLPIFRKAMNHIAIVVGLAQFASSAFDIWLFNNASVDGYLIIRFFVNWPFTTVVILGSFFYLNRRLREIPDFPGLAAFFEQRFSNMQSGNKNRRRSK